MMNSITPEIIDIILKKGTAEDLLDLQRKLNNPLYTFSPRPDKPEEQDEQHSFVFDKFDGLACTIAGNSCIAGDSLIYDPIEKSHRAVATIKTKFHVEAYDKTTGNSVIAIAEEPAVKGIDQLYRVKLSNGQEFEATSKHRLYSKDGWVCVGCLSNKLWQSVPVPLLSNPGICLSTSRQDDRHSMQTLEDYPADCRQGYHSYGEQLRTATNNDRALVPQSVDVLECNRYDFCADDQPELLLECNRVCQSTAPCSSNISCHPLDHFAASESCFVCKSAGYTFRSNNPDVRESLDSSNRQSHTSAACLRSENETSLVPYDSPYVFIESIEPTRVAAFYDFEVPNYHNYCFAGIVHHNSGKTESCCYKLARFLFENEPPDDLCKFPIVSFQLEQAANIWAEKLRHYIRSNHVQSIEWLHEKKQLPKTVILKPHENGNRWQLTFRSIEQGRRALAGISKAAGFWIDEGPVPEDYLSELWTRCREYKFPGSKFWSYTPIDSSDWLEDKFNNREKFPDWKFYGMNAESNFKAGGIADLSWLANTPDYLRETRRVGAFTHLSGAAFPSFLIKTHVKTPRACPISKDATFIRCIDFGYEHVTACVWIAKEPNGRYIVFSEWGEAKLLIAEKAEKIKAQATWDEKDARFITYSDPEDKQQREELAALGVGSTIAKKEPVTFSVEIMNRAMMINSQDGMPNLIVYDTCPNLIQQIKGARWEPSTKKGNRPTSQKLVKVNDDYCDALRMALYSDYRGNVRPWDAAKIPNKNIFDVIDRRKPTKWSPDQ